MLHHLMDLILFCCIATGTFLLFRNDNDGR